MRRDAFFPEPDAQVGKYLLGRAETVDELLERGGRGIHGSRRWPGDQAKRAMPHFEATVAQALRAGDDALRIDALHMIAILQERAPARKSTEIALAIARNSTDPVARAWEASLLNNLGMASAQAGDWTDALLNFKRAQRLRRRAGKPDEERVARWMVAWALRNLGRTEEAHNMQRKFHAEHLAVGSDDPYVREELALLEGS